MDNKRWNGKINGIIYYKDKKINIDGEYLNGKLNGKGKEYDDNGNLIFEEEYLNEEKFNGNG